MYSTSPKKNYDTNKIIYNQNAEIWSIDLADMIEYKISNNKGFRFIFVLLDKFSKYLWSIPLKKTIETTTQDFPLF